MMRRDLPRVAGHLERHPIAAVEALGEQLEPLGRRLDPPGRAQLALLCDRHLTEIAVDVESDVPHLILPSSPTWGEPVGKRHRRIRARGATGQVAGAATEKPGSKPIAR
jgi:hypothetical protein